MRVARTGKAVFRGIVVVCVTMTVAGVQGGEFWKLWTPVTAPAKAVHREKPATCQDPPIEELGRMIDWMEHHIDEYGTVAAKQPDVWGESRLTRHRDEYEKLMAQQMGTFAVTYQAAIARNDQSYLGWAMTLNAAAAGTNTSLGAMGSSDVNSLQGMLGGGSVTSGTTSTAAHLPGFGSSNSLSIEPTMMLAEMDHYLQYLQQLRRTNEGDDTKDSPGYSLNLIRIPISVLPGRKTREGYGAEITVTATPYLTPELLPTTFRNMVMDDLVDLLAPAVTQWVNEKEIQDQCDEIGKAEGSKWSELLDERLKQIESLLRAGKFDDAKKKIDSEFGLNLRGASESNPQGLSIPVDAKIEKEVKAAIAGRVKTAIGEIQTVQKEAANVGANEAADAAKERENAAIGEVQKGVKELVEAAKAALEGRNEAIETVEAALKERRVSKAKRALGPKLTNRSLRFSRASGTKARRAYMPIPPSQLVEVFGKDLMAEIVWETYKALNGSPVNRPQIGYLDVWNFLAEETHAAYSFLGQRTCDEPVFQQGSKKVNRSPLRLAAYEDAPMPEAVPAPAPADMPMQQATTDQCECAPHFWSDTFCGRPLAFAIRTRNDKRVYAVRANYLNCISCDQRSFPKPCETCPKDRDCAASFQYRGPTCRTMTAALGWGLLVEASLLNEQLNQDYYESLISRGMGTDCGMRRCFAFYGPNPLADARQAFIDYVRCRWPVRIFALDPVVDMQNVQDTYSRHRQLQIALAMGFASGKVNAQTMMKFSRQLDWDMQTVALNQTAVGFSTGGDTFGWRFYPRFQTPPTKGNVTAFWESLVGGPTSDQDMRRRQLEPMMRECVAIVLMPSFVPYATFDTRTRFFKLTNPEHGEISMRRNLELSRSIKSMQNSAAQCAAYAQLYRDGEVERLLRRVDQLDKTLPLQTLRIQMPFENTSGGFELFNRGVTDLSPELVGWYGSPGIDRKGTTTLFLIGRSFSVNGMRVIAGGRPVDYAMLSRQVLQVTIPPDCQVVIDPSRGEKDNRLVDVHAATAYGVTEHLLIPVAADSATAGTTSQSAEANLTLAPMKTMTLIYATTTAAGGTVSEPVLQGYEASQRYVEISPQRANSVLQPTLSVNLYLEADGVVVGQSNVSFTYSPQTGKYGAPLDGILAMDSKSTVTSEVQAYLKNNFSPASLAKLRSTPLSLLIGAQVVPSDKGSSYLASVNGKLNLTIKLQ
jgi:hypothetical protein